jgi:hypothetical protein
MGVLLQLSKDFFLIFSTVFIVFWCFKDYHRGLNWYLVLLAFITVIGLNRVMYIERIILPFSIGFGIILNNLKLKKINTIYVFLFIYILFITYINGLTIFDETSQGTYLFVIVLIFSNYLFTSPKRVLQIVFLIWLVTIADALKYCIYGESVFSVKAIDTSTRALINVNTNIKGAIGLIDPNYFGCGQAIGAVITILFVVYRKYIIVNYTTSKIIILKYIFTNNKMLIFLYLVLAIQIWFIIRGLSRGAIFVLIGGIFTMMLLEKKNKYIFYGIVFALIGYIILSGTGILDLYMDRIANDDDSGSGRTIIWMRMFQAAKNHGGFSQFFWGGGNSWPWWKFWSGNFMERGVPSTHNQLLSFWINFGIVGFILFLVPIIKGIRNNLRFNNPINNMRIVLFVCLLLESLTLEPLVYTYYSWFIFALVTSHSIILPKIRTTGNRLIVNDKKNSSKISGF